MDYLTPFISLLISPIIIYSFKWWVFGGSDKESSAPPSTRMPRRYSPGELLDKNGNKIMDL